MPTLAEQEAAARVQIDLYAQTGVPPTVQWTDDELNGILIDCQRATIWTANTAYIIGDVILPTVRNGHRYICIQAGTSAVLSADQPEWTLRIAGLNSDGVSDPGLVWQEDGPDWDNVYDIRRAIHLVWMLKAAKASQLYSTRQSGSGFESQQIYDHCIDMAERYAPVIIA